MATGSWSADLAKQLRLNVPILGGKGLRDDRSAINKPTYISVNASRKRKSPITQELTVYELRHLELVDQDFHHRTSSPRT